MRILLVRDQDAYLFSMLRRILCLPTRDHTSSFADDDDDNSIVTMKEEKAVPGLVARLMGLDSMPADKITRSPDHREENEPKRRRSTYIELLDIIEEDDKFIILSFHNRPRSNRDETFSADAETVKKQEACNQQNSRSKKQIRLVKKKKKKKTENSDESSPISVFDFQQSQQVSETPTSDDDESWTRSSNSSIVSVPSSTGQDNTNISIDPAALLNKKTKAVVVNGQKKNREMWGKVCDITVAEIKADWVDKDLAAEFEVHIMDQLFNELLLLLH